MDRQARRQVPRIVERYSGVLATQPGDSWGPSEESLFVNGLLAARATAGSFLSLPQNGRAPVELGPGGVYDARVQQARGPPHPRHFRARGFDRIEPISRGAL